MYFFTDTLDPISNTTIRAIFTNVKDDSYTSFLLADGCSHMDAYLAWVAEGNTATEYSPE